VCACDGDASGRRFRSRCWERSQAAAGRMRIRAAHRGLEASPPQGLIRGERWDSNPRPPGPQPGALPAELRPPRVLRDFTNGGLGLPPGRLEVPMWWAIPRGAGARSTVAATAPNRHFPKTQEACAFREGPVTSPLSSLNRCLIPKHCTAGDRRNASSSGRFRGLAQTPSAGRTPGNAPGARRRRCALKSEETRRPSGHTAATAGRSSVLASRAVRGWAPRR
jgi:hypothetical protein